MIIGHDPNKRHIEKKYSKYTLKDAERYVELIKDSEKELSDDDKKFMKDYEENIINFRMEYYDLTKEEATANWESEKELLTA